MGALVAEYRFEETAYTGAAGEVLDASGNGHHGKGVGSASSTGSGKTCRAFSVPIESTSTSNAVDTGMDVNVDIGNTGSISFWYYSNSTEYSERVLFDATVLNSARFLLKRHDNSLTPGYKDVDLTLLMTDGGGTNRSLYQSQLFADSTWVHIVAVWNFVAGTNASYLKLYVDGVLKGTDTFTAGGSALSSSIGTLYLGDNRSTASPTLLSSGGVTDSVRIYSHALSASEVSAEYAYTPACTLLHHVEVTTASNPVSADSGVVLTIKACANAACSEVYTGGLSGNVSVSGVTPTYTSGQAFSIGATGSTTETVSMTTGTATVGLTGLSTSAVTTPGVWCGMGVAATSGNSCNLSVAAPFHHLEVTTTATSGLTCAATDFTIKACANGATPCATYTSGVTGNLVLTGTGGSTTAFTISSGNSTATVSKQITKVGTVTASITSPSPVPTNSPATFCGMGTTATSGGSCAYSTASSALIITNLPNHVANVQQTGVTLQAVKSNTDNTACVPGFTGAKSINFTCAYRNPTSGSNAVVVGGSTSLACGSNADGTAQARSLTFDGTGTATTTVQYADVGLVRLTASYSGTAGVDSDVSGFADFIAVPASFAVSPSAGTIKAGDDFSASITAQVSGGGAALNFGKESSPESVTMSWTRVSPTGTGSSAGVFSLGTVGSFSSGVATATGMSWDEVGTGTLTATLTSGSYLGSGLTATGSATAVFVPHHYKVDVNNGCGSTFTYSGQPFGVVVTALNKNGGTTVNNDGSGTLSAITATNITLSAVSNGSTVDQANTTIDKSKFSLGKATVAAATTSPTFTFKSKPYLPTAVAIRATDANASSSSGYTEGDLNLRSGRIKVSNAFGSGATSLSVPVQTQYWKGVSSGSGAATWVVNSQDSCTVVPASAVVLGGYLDRTGTTTGAWPASASAVSIVSGNGVLTLSKPGNVTGSVDFALALGSASTDQSCLNPARTISSSNTGAGLLWLRSQYGSTYGCSGNAAYDRDPSARATFGVFAPETQKAVHVRDIF